MGQSVSTTLTPTEPLSEEKSKLANEAKQRTLNILKTEPFLSEEENKLANEAKQRTLNILKDSLKKKVLVDNPGEMGFRKGLLSVPFISTALVKEMICCLEKVTFRKGKLKKETIAYVRPGDGDNIVYLCDPFWKESEFLERDSRPETLLHEVAHLLGYGHTIKENKAKVEESPQHDLCPVSVYDIQKSFSIYMNHSETYSNGSYSCCGETSRDTVCEKSTMGSILSNNKSTIGDGPSELCNRPMEFTNLKSSLAIYTQSLLIYNQNLMIFSQSFPICNLNHSLTSYTCILKPVKLHPNAGT